MSFRTFVGRSESRLQLRDPEQHQVKTLSTLEENSEWLFVVTFHENQLIETVSEYLQPGIVELHGLGRNHAIKTTVMYSPNNTSTHWPKAETHLNSVQTWRLKLTAHQDAQLNRERVARKFTKIKREPTEEMLQEMEEAKRKTKAARLERTKAETGEFVKAVQEFKLEDFRTLNYKYSEERLKREELEAENAQLKKELALRRQPSHERIEIQRDEKGFKYTLYRLKFNEKYSKTYESRDHVQEFITASGCNAGSN